MPLIKSKIQPQNIELVRNRVAEILQDELEYQFTQFYNSVCDCFVELEGTNPYKDKVELPLVTVSFVKANFNNKNQGQQDGRYQIFVEAFTRAPYSPGKPGDQQATFDLQKLLGVCRYILEDPIYKWLGFKPGFIIRTHIDEEIIYEVIKDDATNTVGGKLVLIAELNEGNDLLVPELADGYLTKAKLYLTDEGYKWDYIQYS